MRTPTALDMVFSEPMPLMGRVAVMLSVRRLSLPTVSRLVLVLRESADKIEEAMKNDELQVR